MKASCLLIFLSLLKLASYGQSIYDEQIKTSKTEEENLFWRCATVERNQALRSKHSFLPSEEEFERFLDQAGRMRAMSRSLLQEEQVIYLPVVVHVIHQGEAEGQGSNISHQQVLSQVEVLNEDFRRKTGTRGYNENPVGSDVRIEFVLAEVDPDGLSLAEQGIHRVNGSELGISGAIDPQQMDETVKPATYWDPNRYLNIWTVDLAENLLGYAQFPINSGLEGVDEEGMASAAETDGVVILYSAFGSSDKGSFSLATPYDKGRTATHEIGHWLGLRHIWGDGGCSMDDYCSDTPAADGPNFGCEEGATSCGSIDMIENYMDYTYDACMNVFTLQQKERMQTVLGFSPRRKELLTSNVIFVETLQAEFTADRQEIKEGQQIAFTDLSKGTVSSWSWSFEGGTPASSTEPNPVVAFDQQGIYAISLSVSNAKGTHEVVKQEHILVRHVAWVNTAPSLVAEPSAQLLQLRESKALFPDDYFYDTDGHALTYSVIVEYDSVLKAAVSGSMLDLNALAAGSTQITLVAEDGWGASSEVVFHAAVNSPPQVLAEPEEQLLQVDEMRSFSMEAFFADLDGDSLSYSFVTGVPSVVDAEVAEATLNLRGLASGASAVKIVAHDQRGGEAELYFYVDVNQQPEVTQTPEDQWLVLEKDTLLLALSELFTDKEGAPLTFQSSVSREGIVWYEIKEEAIRLLALKAAAVTVNLQATDDRQGVGQLSFVVTGHHAPAESQAFPVQELGMGDTVAFNLNEYFSDADGHALRFSTFVEDTTIAVEVKDSLLKVSGLAPGEGSVHIHVTDEKGATFDKSLKVNVVESLGVRGRLQQGTVLVYPNPFTSEVKLKLKGGKPGTYSLLVFDLQGRKVKAAQWEQTGSDSEKVIDLSHLPRGTYLLKIENAEGSTVQRLVKP